MDLSLDPTALARLAAPYGSTDGRESVGGNPAAFHLPLMDPNVSSTPDNGGRVPTEAGGTAERPQGRERKKQRNPSCCADRKVTPKIKIVGVPKAVFTQSERERSAVNPSISDLCM